MEKKTVCKYCGEVIDVRDGFCPVCGAVNRIQAEQDPDKKYCRFCGGELGVVEEYCKICGTPVRRRIEIESTKRPAPREADLKEKKGRETDHLSSDSASSPSEEDGNDGAGKDKSLSFLQKAAMKQREDAELERRYEEKKNEETRAFREENEKLKVSATQAYGKSPKTSRNNDIKIQSTQVYGSDARPVQAQDNSLQSTQPYNGNMPPAGNAEDINRLEKEAAEAGVSVEEILLFEQAKSNFESENETYPDDYNVNDYDQFDYSQSRYGSFNMGSLELETMQYQDQEESQEEPEPVPDTRKRKPAEEKGVIGVKKKKTPLAVRILVFFIAVIAVAGLAAAIMYMGPMMRNVHPEEILLDESIEPTELSITPISASTSTPTPTLTPTPTMTPTPTVNAITPESVTPSTIPVDLSNPVSSEEEISDNDGEEEEFEETPGAGGGELDPGYLVEDSDSRVMDPSELDGRSPEEIRLIANEIYARFGYTFQNEYYAEYFSQFDWYTPSVPAGQFSEDMLSAEAQENLDMIARYEEEHGY